MKKKQFFWQQLLMIVQLKKKKTHLKGQRREGEIWERQHGQQALTTILRKSNICIKTAAIQGSFV